MISSPRPQVLLKPPHACSAPAWGTMTLTPNREQAVCLWGMNDQSQCHQATTHRKGQIVAVVLAWSREARAAEAPHHSWCDHRAGAEARDQAHASNLVSVLMGTGTELLR